MTTDLIESQAVEAFAEHEHLDLVRGINRIRDVACDVGRVRTTVLGAEVDEVLAWLKGTLEPHMAWEEAWLYPQLDDYVGTKWATRAARHHHAQIRDLAGRLRTHHREARGGSSEEHDDLRADLFGIAMLLHAHVELEDQMLTPLIGELRVPARESGTRAPVR